MRISLRMRISCQLPSPSLLCLLTPNPKPSLNLRISCLLILLQLQLISLVLLFDFFKWISTSMYGIRSQQAMMEREKGGEGDRVDEEGRRERLRGVGEGEGGRDFFGHLLLVCLGYSIQRNLLAVDKYHHLLFLFHELIL